MVPKLFGDVTHFQNNNVQSTFLGIQNVLSSLDLSSIFSYFLTSLNLFLARSKQLLSCCDFLHLCHISYMHRHIVNFIVPSNFPLNSPIFMEKKFPGLESGFLSGFQFCTSSGPITKMLMQNL